MQGDYSRVTFDPKRHFSRVLMQQGRVLLDADYNEQTAILLYYLRRLAADVIGPHGGPASADLGFEVVLDGQNLSIGMGHYWVDGFLCENEEKVEFPEKGLTDTGPLLVYLDVWERHITSVEDPRIREVALGGPDTCARAKVVWRVRFVTITEPPTTPLDCLHFEASAQWQGIIAEPNNGMLTASTDQGTPAATPCVASPDARYRGENQLYRVEIHQGGAAAAATFKWSRENASVVFPIEKIAGAIVTVEHLGRDDRFGLEIGDWVEVVDDNTALDTVDDAPERLFRIEDIDTTELTVTLSFEPAAGHDSSKNPFLRRWDHQAGNPDKNGLTVTEDGVAKIVEGKHLNLEDGIQIQFETVAQPPKALYRRGDYWLIPARSTGDIDWPGGAQAPLGVDHHYAPLAIIANSGGAWSVTDLRHRIDPVATCCPKLMVNMDVSNANGVTFVAVVNPVMSGLKYHWSIDGQLQTVTDKQVVVSWGNAAALMATVVVEGLPGGCATSASAFAIRDRTAKAKGVTKRKKR